MASTSTKNPAQLGCDGASEFDLADSEISSKYSASKGLEQAPSLICGYVIDAQLLVEVRRHG